MLVRTVCKRLVVTVTPQTEVIAAAKLMREKHVGFLVVVEPQTLETYGRPVGVLTDRDIVVSVVALEVDPKDLTVADLMSRGPAAVEEGESIEQALRTMRRMGVRRLPVLGARGMLFGVLALDDVLDVLAGEIGELSGAVHNERTIEGVLRP
ncbi:MAG TPA: CBS domain-containing protein [Steroidobacteraceae bacterium]|nr:CBS domain-containing protein [Steroidobacteraceae bacterium]